MLRGSIKTRVRIVMLIAAVMLIAMSMLIGAAFPAGAEEHLAVSLGGGVFASNVYVGADESFITAMPVVRVAYETGKLEVSASLLDGIAIQYLDMDRHILVSFGLNAGDKRDSEEYTAGLFPIEHSDKTKRLLAGSPTASNPIYASVLLGWISPAGFLGGALYYQPTILSGDSDDLYHAFIPSAVYLVPLTVNDKLKMTGMVTLDFMDQNYADAWYTVEDATAELDAFEADAGLRDIQLIFQVDYMFTKHIGATFLAGNLFLLKDAADSPYTRSTYQLQSGLYLFYAF